MENKTIPSALLIAFLIASPVASAGLVTTHDYDDPQDSGAIQTGTNTFGTFVQVAAPPDILHNGAITHSFPTVNSPMGNNFFYPDEEMVVSATETPGPGPDQVTIVIEWKMASGFDTDMIPPWARLLGKPVGSISFAVGTIAVTGGDGIDRDLPFTFDHPSAGSGFFLADFELLGAGGASILDTTWAVKDHGPNGIGGNVIISNQPGGLQTLGITGGRATVRITEIPEPASLALLSIGAVAVLRRRRA